MEPQPTIAYFSMEVGLAPGMPTYAGGLGMLAGDSIRAAADMHVPMVAVSLMHRKGYFFQRFDREGMQLEEPVDWVPEDYVTRLDVRVTLKLEGRDVQVAAHQYDVTGVGGYRVPVILLDTDVPENSEADQTITDYLYGGDVRYRLLQEAVLGVGGVRILRALGCTEVQRFHMNEGHAALLTLELLNEQVVARKRASSDPEVIDAVCRQCVFTTHTPVAAGHDKFPMDLVTRVLAPVLTEPFQSGQSFPLLCRDGVLNMTFLGFTFSHYINGVAKRHGEVAKQLYGQYPIDAITNGVHGPTWVCPPFAALFDNYVPQWRTDTFALRYAISIDNEEIWGAHGLAKRALIERVNHDRNAGFDVDVLTIGFGRRATAYKRPDLILRDPERLKQISERIGPVQLIFAGKAHPQDWAGKEQIQRIIRGIKALYPAVRGAFLPNYDMELCRLMISGVDLWLNTPQPPLEASGTSGMKAALNGVPSLSVLDGWWLEGCIEGYTGWGIGDTTLGGQGKSPAKSTGDEVQDLYDRLEQTIVPLFYQNRDRYIDVMRHAIALNGSFFHAQRMMQHYAAKAYLV